MLDIEKQSIGEYGEISRPFSPQLNARTWYFDPVRELVQRLNPRIQAVNYPVTGVDLSYWQGNIDFAKLSSKIYFAFIRAGRGNKDKDTRYPEYLSGLHQHGRAVGIYWYMMPRTTSNWKDHVNSFIPMYKDSGSQLPPVFDVEENGGMNKTQLTGWIQKAVASFEDQTDVSPMIYTSPGFWNGNTYRNDWAKQLPLWIAHWTTADSPIIPNDWSAINNPKTWTFWQYAVLSNGIEYGVSSARLDHNRYNGSLSQFNSKFKMNLPPLGDVVPPPPPPPPVPTDEIVPLYQVEITPNATPYLNVRAGKGAQFSDIGNVNIGDVLPVTIEDGDWLKIEGYIHKDFTRRV